MNPQHKTIRAMLRAKPLPEAKAILETNLPNREFVSVYYADCKRELLYDVAKRLQCEEPTIKKYRQDGYKKLAILYFCD